MARQTQVSQRPSASPRRQLDKEQCFAAWRWTQVVDASLASPINTDRNATRQECHAVFASVQRRRTEFWSSVVTGLSRCEESVVLPNVTSSRKESMDRPLSRTGVQQRQLESSGASRCATPLAIQSATRTAMNCPLPTGTSLHRKDMSARTACMKSAISVACEVALSTTIRPVPRLSTRRSCGHHRA